MMWLRVVGFVLAALGGIVLFAVGGAYQLWLLQLAGLALVIGCVAGGWRWAMRQSQPTIKPAANPAWSMRDQPAPPRQDEASGK
jgi:hypothetical protein